MISKAIGRLVAVAALALVAPVLSGAAPANVEARLLARQNQERAALGLPPFRWNKDLAAKAREWSDYLAATGQFMHSPDDPSQPFLGENIWGGTPQRFQPEEMIELWLSEKASYKPGVFPANSVTGDVSDVSHYTQIIWEDSQDVGCYVSRGAREEILVCKYSQPGNVFGQRPM